MKNYLTKNWRWLALFSLVIVIVVATIFFANSKKIPVGKSGAIPFAATTVAMYPYDFTGDPSGWTVEEAATNAATYSGAEYIIMQDAKGGEGDAMPLTITQLQEVVAKNNCKQVQVDGIARYIILPEDIAGINLKK